MKQILLSFIIVGCCSGYLSAQEALNSKQLVMLTGTVVDAADGQPVIAATIWYRQSNGRYSAVAATDYDGRFEFPSRRHADGGTDWLQNTEAAAIR